MNISTHIKQVKSLRFIHSTIDQNLIPLEGENNIVKVDREQSKIFAYRRFAKNVLKLLQKRRKKI